jgi:hypothetical protein
MAAFKAAVSAHFGQAAGLILFVVIGACWSTLFSDPAYHRL